MNSAKERLLSTSEGIGEIAETAGYSDQRYFPDSLKDLQALRRRYIEAPLGRANRENLEIIHKALDVVSRQFHYIKVKCP